MFKSIVNHVAIGSQTRTLAGVQNLPRCSLPLALSGADFEGLVSQPQFLTLESLLSDGLHVRQSHFIEQEVQQIDKGCDAIRIDHKTMI